MIILVRKLILIAILMFIPLGLKLFTYLFHQPASIFLKYSPARSDILDADGVLLATTIPTKSVYIIPYEIIESRQTLVDAFSSILNVSKEYVQKRLNAKSKKFVWILRHITPAQAIEIANLEYSGVYVAKDIRRFYPLGALFNHIIGNVDDVNNGISGVERAFDMRLRTDSRPLRLSLKVPVQFVMKSILDEGKKEFSAKAVHGMIICAKTGRILASYSQNEAIESNPHEGYRLDGTAINLNTQVVFEFGSIMKVINAAMLLHNKVVNLRSRIFAPAYWKLGKFTITDVQRTCDREYTFDEAFVKSSNVVHGKLAIVVGLEKQLAFFNLCGIFDAMKIDDLNVVGVIVPKRWTQLNGITATYGYGMAISVAHYVRAFLRITTGLNMDLHLLQNFQQNASEKKVILDKSTINDMRTLLRLAFKETLSGKKNEIVGYNIAGKTGTANKIKNGKYIEKCNRCSYIFVFPANDPQIIGMVIIDEPQASAKTFGWATAGWNAAPLAHKIIHRIGPILNISKDNETM